MHDTTPCQATAERLSHSAQVPMLADPASMTAASIRETIETWTDLKPSQRSPLLTAVNHAADLLVANRHLLGDFAPWSCAGLNRVLWRSGEPVLGLTRDVFRNMVTALRKVLFRLGTHADSGYGRNKLSPAWEALHQALPTDEYRKGLLRFFRYLTLEGITPETINPESINQFDTWCRTAILCADPTELSRRSAGNWEFARKTVPGWPQVELRRQGQRDQYALPFDIYPASLNADVERFLRNPAPVSDAPVKAGNPYTSLALAKKQAVADDAAVEAAAGRKTPRSGRRARTKRTSVSSCARSPSSRRACPRGNWTICRSISRWSRRTGSLACPRKTAPGSPRCSGTRPIRCCWACPRIG